MVNISSSVATVLTADAQNLNAGLAAADLRIDKFASNATKQVGKVDKAFGKLKGVGGSFVAGGAAGLAAGFATSIGGQVASSIENAFKSATERLKDKGLILERSKFFNMAPEEYSILESGVGAVGGNAKEFMESLGSISTALANAQNGSEAATRAFRELGIDTAAFGQLGGFQQVMTVFDKLAKYQGNKFDVGGLLLGTDGVKNMIPALNLGAEAFIALGKQTSLTRDEIIRAKVASEELAKAESAMGAAYDKVLIAMTPVFHYVGRTVPELLKGTDFNKLGQQATGAFFDLAEGMAAFADSFTGAKKDFDEMFNGDTIIGGIRKFYARFSNVWDEITLYILQESAKLRSLWGGDNTSLDAQIAKTKKDQVERSKWLADPTYTAPVDPSSLQGQARAWRDRVERDRAERERKMSDDVNKGLTNKAAPTGPGMLDVASAIGIAAALEGMEAERARREAERQAKADQRVAQALSSGSSGANEVIARFEGLQTEAKLTLKVQQDQLEAQKETNRILDKQRGKVLGAF